MEWVWINIVLCSNYFAGDVHFFVFQGSSFINNLSAYCIDSVRTIYSKFSLHFSGSVYPNLSEELTSLSFRSFQQAMTKRIILCFLFFVFIFSVQANLHTNLVSSLISWFGLITFYFPFFMIQLPFVSYFCLCFSLFDYACCNQGKAL